MSVALLALFVALGGSAYAATGGNFVLGRANKATTTTALTGTPASGSALAVTNGTSGLPAAAFKVTGGGTPLTVNSSARVSNLNADLLDGLDSAAFEPASNSVPMNILQFSVGQAKRFDIGPYASFGVSCYGSGGTTHLDLTIYNHSISDMQVDWSELLGGPSPAPTPNVGAAELATGGSAVFRPLTSTGGTVARDHGTVIMRDDSGEVVTALFTAAVGTDGCDLWGTLTRTT